MALISLALLVVSLAALLFPWGFHEGIAVLLFVTLVLHNTSSKGFYRKLLGKEELGREKSDTVVILLLLVSFVVCYAAGVLLFLSLETGFALGLVRVWQVAHMVSAMAAVALTVLHMKHEWM